MKRKLVLFIASLLILGSINAQEDHWSMNSYDYMNARPFYGKVMIAFVTIGYNRHVLGIRFVKKATRRDMIFCLSKITAISTTVV